MSKITLDNNGVFVKFYGVSNTIEIIITDEDNFKQRIVIDAYNGQLESLIENLTKVKNFV